MTIQIDLIIERLLFHAGLCRGIESSNGLSMVLWDLEQSEFNGISTDRFSKVIEDVLQLVIEANDTLSQTRLGTLPTERTLPDPLAYSISHIMLLMLHAIRKAKAAHVDSSTERLLFASAEVITFCWDLFMAGDIADLRQDVRLEVAMNYDGIFSRSVGEKGIF